MASHKKGAADYYCKFCALESQGLDIGESEEGGEFKIGEIITEQKPKIKNKEIESVKYICRKHLNMSCSGRETFRSRSPRDASRSPREFENTICFSDDKYKLNIRNREIRRPRSKSDAGKYRAEKGQKVKKSEDKMDDKSVRSLRTSKEIAESSDCGCQGYHKHVLCCAEFCHPKLDEVFASQLEKSTINADKNLESFNDRHLNICNTFWYPALSMNEYKNGDKKIEFTSLWLKVVNTAENFIFERHQ